MKPMTSTQLVALVEEFGYKKVLETLVNLDTYERKKQYKDIYRTILRWLSKSWD